MWSLRSCVVALAGSILPSGVASAQVGVQSTVGSVPMSAVMASSIAVSVGSGAIQTLSSVIDNAANTFPTPVSITLTWDLQPSTGSVEVVAYFANATAAMTSGPEAVPSSWLQGRVLTAGVPSAPTAFTAFTQNAVGGVGTPGASLSLTRQPILGYSRTGTRTFDLELQLDLTGRVLTPGAYTGTLNIRAVTQ